MSNQQRKKQVWLSYSGIVASIFLQLTHAELLQTPTEQYIQPKPNLMFVMESAKKGLTEKFNLSKEEKEYFGITANEISKAEGIGLVLARLMDEYYGVAHFGLAKTNVTTPDIFVNIDHECNTLTTNCRRDDPSIQYYTQDEIMLNTIINPIFDNSEAPYRQYAGNYTEMHSKEAELNKTIQNNLFNFYKNYSSQKYSTSAWSTSLMDIHSYLESETVYDELPNKGIIDKALKEGTVVNGKAIKGIERLEYVAYPDPVNFACQQSHILYFPIETSKGDDEYVWDKMMEYEDQDAYPLASRYISSNQLPSPANYDSLKKYKAALPKNHSSTVTGLALALHTTPTYVSKDNAYRSKKETLDGKDLHGNHYINKDGNLVYNPAKFGISAIYTGKPISIPYSFSQNGMTRWNETDPAAVIEYNGQITHKDHLANFISIYSRNNKAPAEQFRDPENRMVGNTENGSASGGSLWENSIYLRANKDEDSTLMGVYLRTKEWIDRMILQNRNDGRIFSDQYGYEGFAKDITYTATYNPQLWTSNIIIYEPRIAKNGGRSGHIADYLSDPQHQTQNTIKYDQGDFFTFDEKLGKKQELNSINLGGTATPVDVEWLKGRLDLDPLKYRNRNTPLGDIVNSSIKYAARDHFYINLDLVGNRELYADYMRKKSDNFQQNLLIAGSNDGFLNFIVAARNSKNEKGVSEVGQRKTSYFVPFFKKDLREIIQGWDTRITQSKYINKFQHKYRVDGHINLMDGIVGKEFKTIGISMMGAGYKGLTGFELFSINDDGKKINNDIKPLFTISNETSGFEKLGNTFSEVSFFNEGEGDAARIVGVFGNSGLFGKERKDSKSVIYFIDAVTGEKIGEIDVSHLAVDGTKGAGSPALVLSSDGVQGQNLDAIYFGDRSGRLYKVDFKKASGNTLENKIENALAQTKVLFHYDLEIDDELNAKAIMHKPLIKNDVNKKDLWVYFGTGWRVTGKDIKDSKNQDVKEQYLIAIKDKQSGNNNLLTLSDLKKVNMTSFPNNKTYSYVNGGGRQELSINTAESNNDLGWYVNVGVPFMSHMLADTKLERIELPALLTGSPAIINNPAEPNSDFIIFSSRGLVRYTVNDGSTVYPEFKNYCMPDLVQSHVGTLAAFTGEKSLPSDSHYLSDRKTTRQGNIMIPQLGMVAPFRSYGLLQADSKLGNLNNGFNFSLLPEEREYLDKDATPIGNSSAHYYLGINGSSSNIGGRSELNANSLSYTAKYQANQLPMANGIPAFVFEIPHSSYFGAEGMFQGNTTGSTPVPVEVKLQSKRLSIRNKY